MSGDSGSIVLVLICGPPASGKTTLATNLKEKLGRCLLFSFDQIFSNEEQENAVKTKGHLKMLRRVMFEGVENLLDGEFNTEAAKKILKCQTDVNRDTFIQDWQFILIDDNLYLSSMRYCWFQAARALTRCVMDGMVISAGGLSLCNIYVSTSLDECLRRNRQRESPVLERVLVEQFHRMEPPTSGGHQSELFSFVAETSDTSQYSAMVERCLTVISAAQSSPLKPLEDSEAVQERVDASRRETKSSKSHNLDLAFRKAVTSLVSRESCSSEKQRIWMRANSLKAEIVNDPSIEALSLELKTSTGNERKKMETKLQELIECGLKKKLPLK